MGYDASSMEIKKKNPLVAIISGIGTGVVVVAFSALVITGFSGHLCGWTEPGNFHVPGDSRNFDPVAEFDAVAEKAGEGAVFTAFEARFVRSDGTLDLHASYKPTVVYGFMRENTDRDPSVPKGAGGPQDHSYEGVTMTISKPGRVSKVTRTGSGCRSGEYPVRWFGMHKTTSSSRQGPDKVLEKPRCSLKKLWDVAKTRGFDPSAVAIISYDEDGYQFWIQGDKQRLYFDHSCRLDEPGEMEFKGNLQSESSLMGNWTLSPSECSPGSHKGKFGVNLSDGKNWVRIVQESSEKIMVVAPLIGEEAKPNMAMELRECKVIEGELKREHVRADIIVSGKVKIDCDLSERGKPKGRLWGELEFKNCNL